MKLFKFGFFHLAEWLWGSFKLLHVSNSFIAEKYSVAWTYHNSIIHLFIKDIWVFSDLGNFKLSCYKHFYTGFCVNVSLQFFSVNTQEWDS